MAQQLYCDICASEEPVQMLTNLADGSVLMLGPACLPQFYGHSVLAVLDAGEHKGPAGKCQACRRTHERMTTPAAPAGAGDAPEGTTTNEPADTDRGTAQPDEQIRQAAG